MIPNFSEVEFYVKSTDCSMDFCLAPYVLLSDLQESADKGANDCGWGRDYINSQGFCWIVLRCELDIIRLPSWREKFTVRTWSEGCKKLFWDREYEVFDSNGEVIAKGTSVWILANMNDHSPVFPSKLVGASNFTPQRNLMALGHSCPKLKVPDINFFEKPVVLSKYGDYTELDHNHHVNNTRYVAWIYDALYKDGRSLTNVKNININYISEVKSGEKVDIYIQDEDDGILVCGYKNENVGVFASKLKFCV